MRRRQRIGIFQVELMFIREFEPVVREFFKAIDALVVEARYRYDYDAIEYVAVSEKFEEVGENLPASRYSIDSFYEEKADDWPRTGHRYVTLVKIALGTKGGKDKRFHNGKEELT
jgi:hypothetical protein